MAIFRLSGGLNYLDDRVQDERVNEQSAPPQQMSTSEMTPHSTPSRLNDVEAATREYPRGHPSPSSPAMPVRPPSIADSVTSQVYHPSRPTTPVRRSSQSDTLRRRDRSSTPVSVRRRVANPPARANTLPPVRSVLGRVVGWGRGHYLDRVQDERVNEQPAPLQQTSPSEITPYHYHV